MVAQVDKQHTAVIALAVDPARQADGRSNVVGSKGIAIMGAVGVHGIGLAEEMSFRRREISRWRFAFAAPFVKARGCRYGRRR
jgi:hypothetical protein